MALAGERDDADLLQLRVRGSEGLTDNWRPITDDWEQIQTAVLSLLSVVSRLRSVVSSG
jgi:hypothetical protein